MSSGPDVEKQLAGKHGRDLIYGFRLGLLLAGIVLAIFVTYYYLTLKDFS